MEQRPTSSQLQQQLAKQQQQCEQQALSACKQAAASAAETAAARAVAAALEGEGFPAQLKVLEMRVETLEEGMQTTAMDGAGAAPAAAARPAAPAVYAAHCASQEGSAAAAAGPLPPSASATSAALGAAMAAQGSAQLALLLRQVGEVQLQLLGKADKVELEQQLLALRHALQDSVQGAVTRDDFEDRMSRKLDVDTFLASVAARQKAAREREQARERQRAGGS